MASYPEYVERKHRLFFRYLDLDSDSKVFRNDLVNRVERRSKVNVTSEEESTNSLYRWMKYVDCIFQGKDYVFVTEEAFVKRHREIWFSDLKYELSLIICGIYDVLFDRLDANRDGQISTEELKAYYNAIGNATDDFIDKVLKSLDKDKDGRLTKNEFMNGGKLFWFGEDPSTETHMMYNVHN